MSTQRLRIGTQLEQSTTPGSIAKTDASNNQFYLPPGTNGQVLTVVGGTPVYATPAITGVQHDLRLNGTLAERGSDDPSSANGAAFLHHNYSHLSGFNDHWMGANGIWFPTTTIRNDGDFFVGFRDPYGVAFENNGFIFDYSKAAFSGGVNSTTHFNALGNYAFNWSQRSTASGASAKNFGDFSTVSSNDAFNFGYLSTVSGNFSGNFGRSGTVSGSESVNFAPSGNVSGNGSMNFGQFGNVSSSNAVNTGDLGVVSGFRGMNFGYQGNVSGVHAFNSAQNGTVSGGGATFLGINPIVFTGQISASGGDFANKFFVIGNGLDITTRSNALTMTQAGYTQIWTNEVATGITAKAANQVTPKAAFEVVSKTQGILIPTLNSTDAATRLAAMATASFTKLMIDPSGAANNRVLQPAADYTGDGSSDPAGYYVHDNEGEMWYNVELRTHQRIVWDSISAAYIIQTF